MPICEEAIHCNATWIFAIFKWRKQQKEKQLKTIEWQKKIEKNKKKRLEKYCLMALQSFAMSLIILFVKILCEWREHIACIRACYWLAIHMCFWPACNRQSVIRPEIQSRTRVVVVFFSANISNSQYRYICLIVKHFICASISLLLFFFLCYFDLSELAIFGTVILIVSQEKK